MVLRQKFKNLLLILTSGRFARSERKYGQLQAFGDGNKTIGYGGPTGSSKRLSFAHCITEMWNLNFFNQNDGGHSWSSLSMTDSLGSPR